MAQFEKAQAEARQRGGTAESAESIGSAPLLLATEHQTTPRLPERLPTDFTLWDPKRVALHDESFDAELELPLAILEIPRLALRVPVLDGTDDLRLNRGVGRIVGTARPGEVGNIGIAGHRDGFFRGLQDISPGDELRLESVSEVAVFKVKSVSIVLPEDTYVLDPSDDTVLTLVTCYPFYFIGKAPQRYIVRAQLERTAALTESTSESSMSIASQK